MESRNDRLLRRERQFRDFHIWPLSRKMDIRRWLSNFTDNEQTFAIRLASRFTYFEDAAVDALFKSSIQRLVNVSSASGCFNSADPFHRVAFVAVTGEEPSITDSGHFFGRKARALLSIAEDSLLWPEQALERSSEFDAFIFIDDFVGSGNQMNDTWKRVYAGTGVANTFKDLAAHPDSANKLFAYCACISTLTGLNSLSIEIPGLVFSVSHVLGDEANLILEASGAWNNDELKAASDFLRDTGHRAGFTAQDEGEDDWRGFHKLGLGVAFAHGMPDACLAIFRSTRNGWLPLVNYT